MAKFKWEEIAGGSHDSQGHVLRAKVPGGWLVYYCERGTFEPTPTGGLTFYPDPKHEWDGGTL